MRTLPVLLLTLMACDEAPSREGDGEDSGKERPAATEKEMRWSEDAGRLSLDGRIQSQAIRSSQSGAWTTRAAGAADGGMEGARWRGAPEGMAMPMPAAPPVMEAPMSVSSGGSGADLGTLDYAMPDNAQAAGQLRAGATNDNAEFDAYLRYLSEGYARPEMDEVGGIDRLNVAGRRMVQALDAAGAPLPGARVSIVDADTDRLVWTGRTQGDGRLPFYPDLYEAPGLTTEHGAWTVQVEHNGAVEVVRWPASGAEELDVRLDVQPRAAPVKVDVCFIIDTTGSMGDEIARVKDTLLSVTARLRGDAREEVDLRYGAVLYRDVGDEYLTQAHPFTSDIQAFDQALQQIQAGGGGDGPESLNQGLAVAMGGMDWREGTAKVAFLIADAPPHMDYQEDVPYSRGALAALHNGVRVHTVAASGLDDRGSLVFRQIAQLTRGKFVFIEYGSTAASAADHGVTGSVASNNLDAILYEQIHAEIQGWGREPAAVAGR